MFACCWWAVDEDGRSWCYRYFEQKGLVIKDAAKAIVDHTPPGENVQITYAPPDMWAKSKDTGREIAEVFRENGVPIVKANNIFITPYIYIHYCCCYEKARRNSLFYAL